MNRKVTFPVLVGLALVGLTACKHEVVEPNMPASIEEETYAGGKLGTTFNQSASAFEDPTPAVENAGMVNAFKYGEFFFEHTITQNNPPFNGLGPLYVRSSCEACHPGYGHGRRMERYRADDWANGYLLVVYNKTTDAYETSVAGMPQTKAVPPFKASIDESKINIAWLDYTDEWGNRFPDGETYSLIYPEVTIPEDAFYAPLSAPYSQMAFRLESTIGIYGTGLLDAIPDDSLKAQYQKEYEAGANLNPAIWAGNDWASLYGKTTHPKRFTYALSRGPLQDAAGANAIWNITNVNRSDRRSHYLSLNKSIYANTAADDPEVQAHFYHYFPAWNKTGDPRTDIYNYLMCGLHRPARTQTLPRPGLRHLPSSQLDHRPRQLHRPQWLLCRRRQPAAPLPLPKDLALHRHGAAPSLHGQRHPHWLVPHHSAVGTRSVAHLQRSQRPPA